MLNVSIIIVKLNKEPIIKLFENQIKLVEIEVLFSYFIEEKSFFEKFNLIFWDDLGDLVIKYYREGDYTLVEGFLTTDLSIDQDKLENMEKKLEFNVLNIYPLF